MLLCVFELQLLKRLLIFVETVLVSPAGINTMMTKATCRTKSLFGLLVSALKVHHKREESALLLEQEGDCKVKAEEGNWELMESLSPQCSHQNRNPSRSLIA